MREVFSQENTPEGHTETHESSFVPYKQVSGRNGNHEWLRITNAFILADLVWKVQQSYLQLYEHQQLKAKHTVLSMTSYI